MWIILLKQCPISDLAIRNDFVCWMFVVDVYTFFFLNDILPNQLDCWDFKYEITQIHLANLPSASSSAGQNMTRLISVLLKNWELPTFSTGSEKIELSCTQCDRQNICPLNFNSFFVCLFVSVLYFSHVVYRLHYSWTCEIQHTKMWRFHQACQVIIIAKLPLSLYVCPINMYYLPKSIPLQMFVECSILKPLWSIFRYHIMKWNKYEKELWLTVMYFFSMLFFFH